MHIQQPLRDELEAKLYAEFGEELSKRKGSHVSFDEFKFYLHREEDAMRRENSTTHRQLNKSQTMFSKGTH